MQPKDHHQYTDSTSLLSSESGFSKSYQIITQDGPVIADYASVNSGNSEPKSSSFSAFFHIVCVMAGTGILQLPYALKSGGWLSLSWVFISGYLVYHSGRFLNACLYHDGVNRLAGIMEVGGTALGAPGRRLVEFSFSTLIIGASGLYLILAANNLMLMDQWTGWSRRGWVFVCMLVSCIPFITIKTLKEASFLSLFGVISTVIMVLVVVVVAFCDFETLHSSKGGLPSPTVILTYDWINWSSLPLSLASISFSFGGNIVFPHVEHSMQNPKQFNSVLKWSLIFVTAIYSLVAAVGYLAYGQNTVSPIFNNLQPSIYVTIAMAMLTLHVLLTIPINLTSFALDAEHAMGISSEYLTPQRENLFRIIFRVFLSLATLSLAIIVPFFDHVMALLGAMSNGLLVFILPPIFYMKLYGWSTCSTKDKAAAIAMGATGVFVLVIGSSQALLALYQDFHQS